METNELLRKVDLGEKFNERELSDLLEYEYRREEGEDRRWTKNITSYIKLDNRIFALNWMKGLTENQENDFDEQPYEVKENIEERVIKTKVYIYTRM